MQPELYGGCTVCGQRLTEKREFGNRHYCERHLGMLAEDVRPVWRASLLTFGVIALMVAGIGVAGGLFRAQPEGTVRLAIGASVSVLPALVWLFALFRYSASDGTQLSSLVPIITVLAALVAAAIARPILLDLINLDSWLARAGPSERLTAHILVGSTIHITLLYAIVRYTVWRTPTFEHRVDGVVFAMAAGWGYAATMNLLFALEGGGLLLVNGSLRMIAQMAAYLSASLVIGFFLGRNRFEDMPLYYMSSGMTLAALVTGTLFYAGTELNRIRLNLVSDGFSPWPGLVLSLAALVITYSAVYGLLRRHNALTKARLEQGR